MRGLDEYIFQDKQHREDIHRRRDFRELTAQNIQRNITNHTQQNTIRDRVCQRHHNDTDEGWDSL